MRNLIFIVLGFFVFSCHKNQSPMLNLKEDKYKLIQEKKVNYSDLNTLKKQFRKSNVELFFDSSTGLFHGESQGIPFTGRFDIKKTSAGILKGFSYKVELAYLSYPELDEKNDFIENLAIASRIKIEPDILLDPNYLTMEIISKSNENRMVLLYLKSK